jgi:hypothetical protein
LSDLLIYTEFTIFGGLSERVTPVPIPNTEVKPLSADGTARVTWWESRSPPNSFFFFTLKILPGYAPGRIFFCPSLPLVLEDNNVKREASYLTSLF